jgi:superfamily II DNA or RNA helicase
VNQADYQPVRSDWSNYILELFTTRPGSDRRVLSKKVEQIDMVSNIAIREWDSVNAAGRALGISVNEINAVLNNEMDTAGGYKWKYNYVVEEEKPEADDDVEEDAGLSEEQKKAKEDSWKLKLYETSKEYRGGGTLRDYQVEVINNFLSNPQCIQEIATGAGKTVITAALSNAVAPHGRTIVIVPNKSLVTQTEKDYINMQQDVGVFFGDRKEWGRQHTICTWQSLNVLLKNTKNSVGDVTIQEFLEDVVCVIVDEVHMAKADALKTLLTGVMSCVPLRWGLTGTVPKEPYEFQALKCSLGPVINHLSASELQDRGVLAQCHVNVVQLVDHAEFTNYQSELKFLLEEPDRLKTMAGLIAQVNATGNTLVLVDRVAAGHALAALLGEAAVFVSGATKAKARQDEYDEISISSGKIIIATYGIAAVGINIPRIFNLVLIEPGKSFVRVIQSIGRGIRKAEDKDHVEIWDVTSTCKFAKRHLTKRKAFYKEANYPFTQEKLEWK